MPVQFVLGAVTFRTTLLLFSELDAAVSIFINCAQLRNLAMSDKGKQRADKRSRSPERDAIERDSASSSSTDSEDQRPRTRPVAHVHPMPRVR